MFVTRTVGGRYRLYEFLAGGDTGEVWQALDLGTDRTVAVKLLYPDLAADPRLVDRFVRARGQLTMLWHPSIARLLDIVVEEGTLALVSDLVPGVDLGRRLAREGPLDAGSASAVGAAVADALSAAHQFGVVHGDVKPSNVVVPARGEGAARLTDFSVMLLVRAGRRYPEPFERLRYRAPEVTDGAVPVPPSDVYAFGAMLAEMLPGDSPARLRMIADECVRADPGARPSAAEISHELGMLATRLESAPVAAAPPARAAIGDGPPRARARGGPRGRGPAWLFGSPTRLAIAFGVAVLLVLGAFAVTRPWEPASDQGGGATRTPSESTGGAASATRTSKAPALPAAAGAHSREGGAAFVRYWFSLVNHAQGTGDTEPLRAVAGPGCRECEQVVKLIDTAYGDGGSMRGGVYVVRNVATNGLFTLDAPIYEATLDRSPRATLDRTGVERESLAGLTVANCMVSLDWTSDRWRVVGVPTAGCLA
ncbi:hypothetical protein GCM10023170_005530 [Phytohabitans houttuyneae]|uniref:non-specific serine/threonine protein kinase n=1 Tax=Phytohabitans houttuyneae TaxID=1076126 RepID=A0A6V8K1C8_9ACTN|nr:hypothetical protein Phou_031020 [Phytohabitans houttuyneae]